MKQRRPAMWLAPAIALVLTFTVSAFGQGSCVEVCGDFNHDGRFDVADLIGLTDYLMNGGPPPVCYDESEYDGRLLVTFYDLEWLLISFPFEKQGYWPCAATEPPLVPSPDPGHYVQIRLCDLTVPPGVTSMTVPVLLNNYTGIRAFSLPLRFRVGYDIPTVSLDSWQLVEGDFDMGPFFHADNAGQVHLAAGSFLSLPSISGLNPLATLHLEFPYSAATRQLSIEWTTLPPEQDSSEVIVPMIIEGLYGASPDDFPAKAPDLIVKFCTKRGDFDGDVELTVSDLTQMIQCIFGDCFYPCPEFLDIDASGSWNISDITYFVAYLFQGGPEPPPC